MPIKCGDRKGNDKDVCKAEAKRDRDVGKADADASRDGAAKTKAKAHKVKADRDYDVAKEMCGDRNGNDKDVCLKEAKVFHQKALGAARVEKAAATGISADVAEVRREAKKNTPNAKCKADREKCDVMSGDAKDKCTSAVKAKYGK